jgi:hypothetical protein
VAVQALTSPAVAPVFIGAAERQPLNAGGGQTTRVKHGQAGGFARRGGDQGSPDHQGQDHARPPPLQRHRDRQPRRQRRARRAADGGADVFIEDLNSTNGTYINGKAIKKQLLTHNDTVEIGKYKIKYLVDEGGDYEKTMIMRPAGRHAAGFCTRRAGAPPLRRPAPRAPCSRPSIKVLNGAAAGREVALTKVVTTVGKPGVQVASITKRPNGYAFAHVEGATRPSVNGVPWSATRCRCATAT